MIKNKNSIIGMVYKSKSYGSKDWMLVWAWNTNDQLLVYEVHIAKWNDF